MVFSDQGSLQVVTDSSGAVVDVNSDAVKAVAGIRKSGRSSTLYAIEGAFATLRYGGISSFCPLGLSLADGKRSAKASVVSESDLRMKLVEGKLRLAHGGPADGIMLLRGQVICVSDRLGELFTNLIKR